MLALISVIIAISSGLIAFVFKRWPTISKYISFILLGISGATAAFVGAQTLITQNTFNYFVNSGLYQIIFQFKLDSLSGFFLFIVGIIVVSVAIYAPSYMRVYEKQRSIAGMTFFTGLFISGMYLVLLANDAFSFILAWELMSVSSYFLVAYHHEHAANRSAALLYILMAHASGILILLGFSILIKFSNINGFSFTAMQTATLTPLWSNLAFFLALAGFGMKAGVIPLHVWLPRAHPAAPSHISALMSGVMLKVAIYGFLRFCFDLLKNIQWQWGIIILFIGTISALFGVLYALMQHDLKKLLAYSSVENIGIIFIGIGLSFIFLSTGHPVLSALGLIAALYHCLNHAIFKSLLFLGAGSILQKGHEHDLEKMGGLIHKMPYTALFFLIGCISISALPLFNGFVSEWLTFQTALHAGILKSGILRSILPITAAMLALTGALAAACFVKVYGVAFLGQARSKNVRHASDSSFSMSLSMGFLSLLCLLFGLFPASITQILNIIPQNLIGAKLEFSGHNWLWLIPASNGFASYSAPISFIMIIIILLTGFGLLRLLFRKVKVKSIMPWECGFGAINPRMQYSATAFAMPLRRVFKGVWKVSETIEKISVLNTERLSEKIKPQSFFLKKINYSLNISDWVWEYFYEPLTRYISIIARFVGRIQAGNIRIYLAYTFFTLIILLWVIS